MKRIDSKINLDDPKLTAFALGELEGEEEIQMKQVIDQDPEAKKQVDEIRATANMLSDELQKEARPRLSVAQREEILAKTLGRRPTRGAWWKSWKVGLSLGGSLAAAVIAVLVMNSNGTLSRLAQVKETAETGPISAASPEMLTDSPGKSEAVAEFPKAPPAVAPSTSVVAEFDGRAGDDSSSMAELADTEFEEARRAEPMEISKDSKPSSQPGGVGRIQNLADASGAAAPAKGGATTGSSVTLLTRGHGTGVGLGGLAESKAKRAVPSLAQKEASNTEAYSFVTENEFKLVADQPLSTVSTDVDTASYANVRRFLVGSQKPPADAVRIEEMVNYFKYDYPTPTDGKAFSVTTEVAVAPWNANHQLLRIGLKGRESSLENRPASNLVFLIDVSGSMDEPNKLPLLVKSFKLLTEQMRARDHVAMVVYAGSSGVVLPSTAGNEKAKIVEALDRLHAGGSTNGASGIQQAYDVAAKGFIKGGVNRVILATDGDFNVGATSESELVRLIEEKAKTGVYLTVLGFGMGNYKDATMQKLANKGNGNHAYIDSIREARKVLVEQAGGTLNTIAKDVKIQIEFNPKAVGSYRLIGYEKRVLNNEDFNDDTKDAGDIGEGHTVTALYELAPVGEIGGGDPKVDSLKYQAKPEIRANPAAASDELLTVKLRFKKPDGDVSEKIEVPVKNEKKEFAKASSDMKFASSVAGFGMLLRGSKHRGDLTYDQVQKIASENLKLRGTDDPYRKEFVELVKKAKSLK